MKPLRRDIVLVDAEPALLLTEEDEIQRRIPPLVLN